MVGAYVFYARNSVVGVSTNDGLQPYAAVRRSRRVLDRLDNNSRTTAVVDLYYCSLVPFLFRGRPNHDDVASAGRTLATAVGGVEGERSCFVNPFSLGWVVTTDNMEHSLPELSQPPIIPTEIYTTHRNLRGPCLVV